MSPDPKVRADGMCAQCGKPRKITKQARTYAGGQVDLDPFCASSCARKYHGCELKGVQSEAQIEAQRASAAAYRAAKDAA